MKWRHFIQFSTWKLPCISDSLLQYEQASYKKHVKASFWLHCRVLQTSLLPYKAAACVRGPLNQLLCGSVNRVNVTHLVENCTSTPASVWAYMVSLINLDLVMAVWSLKRMSSSDGRTRKCHPTWIENVPPPLFKVHAGWVWLVSVFVPGIGLLHLIWAQDMTVFLNHSACLGTWFSNIILRLWMILYLTLRNSTAPKVNIGILHWDAQN